MKKVNMIFREKKPLFWMALAFVMMIGVLSLCVWPLFSRLSADQALWQDLMRHPLLAQGAMSVVMALQVVLAFLPGEPVELLCGYLFGTIGGMAVCVIGSMIGSALIFLLVRKLGERRVHVSAREGRAGVLERKNRGWFIIFLIPGTPKDILTYCMPLTDIRFSSFLLITGLARIPSIITSTMGASTFRMGEYGIMAAVLGITALLSLGGLWLYRYIFVHKK
ncbi:MAG: TVP38/TMEM64 family protein [Merdibacter sp.]